MLGDSAWPTTYCDHPARPFYDRRPRLVRVPLAEASPAEVPPSPDSPRPAGASPTVNPQTSRISHTSECLGQKSPCSSIVHPSLLAKRRGKGSEVNRSAAPGLRTWNVTK